MNFSDYSNLYDQLYLDKNYKEECDYVDNLIRSLKQDYKNIRILELGSGTGIHGQLLSQKGYHLTGIELSQNMIDKAYERECGFKIYQGDIRKPVVSGKFDIVISLFHVISYQVSNEDIISVFEQVYKNLEDNGLFIFDFWYSEAVINLKPSNRVKRVEKNNLSIVRIGEPVVKGQSNRVDVNYQFFYREDEGEWKEFKEIHSMRHFSIPELKLIANQCGMELIHTEEFLSKKELNNTTWNATCVFRKNED